MSKKFKGKDIKEVWNYRLSKAVPVLDERGDTWVVKIFAKDNADYNPNDPKTMAKPLEEHDTGVKTTGNPYDEKAVIKCYEWLYSVRDKYALDNIEEMKPHVAKIEEANKALAAMGGE